MNFRSALFLVFFGISLLTHAQTTTFYKDAGLTKMCSEKKAKFKRVEFTDDEGTKIIQVLNIKSECLVKEEKYKNDLPAGVWWDYDEDCNFVLERDFNKLVYSDSLLPIYGNKEVELPEDFVMAQYGDSPTGVLTYISHNFVYPKEARKQGISGKIYLQILIKETGEVEVVSIIKSAHPLLDLNAWMVLENMPNWTPATIGGKPVQSIYIIPMNLQLG